MNRSMQDRGAAALLALPALLVLLAAPAGAAAQTLADYDYENLAFRGAGLDYGYVWPNRVEPTPAYTVRFDLGYLGPMVRVVPSVTYWVSQVRNEELERLAEQINRLETLQRQGVRLTAVDLGTIDWRNLAFATDLQLAWIAPGRLLTYAGAGAAIHAMNGRGAAIDDTFIDGLLDAVTAGIAATAGVEWMALDALRVYGEARYTLMDDLRYPTVRMGLAFMMPGHGDAPR